MKRRHRWWCFPGRDDGPRRQADELELPEDSGDFVYTGWVEFVPSTIGQSPNRTVGILGVFAHVMNDGGGSQLSGGHEMQYTDAAEIDVSIERFPVP